MPDFMPLADVGLTPSHFASVRFNNPGAMYPGQAAKMFGSTGTATIGGGHLIAQFPTPVHGAAANMQNIINGGYVGLPIQEAIKKWSGSGRSSVPGFDGKQTITPEMTRDPNFMIPFMKAVASGEAPGRYPMSDEQWREAYTAYATGGTPAAGSGGGYTGQGRRSAAGGPPVTQGGVAGALAALGDLGGRGGGAGLSGGLSGPFSAFAPPVYGAPAPIQPIQFAPIDQLGARRYG